VQQRCGAPLRRLSALGVSAMMHGYLPFDKFGTQLAAFRTWRNALRWLVAEQGGAYGGRTFLCWIPQGTKLPSPVGVFRKRSKTPVIKPSEYREELLHTLNGWNLAEGVD
jgi:hypothetical protein